MSGFDLADLGKTGNRPEDAMPRFRDWLAGACTGGTPVFVGFNAGFDWSFVNWYFHRFLGANPFGFAPLDVKSYYMGMTGCRWEETKSSRIRPEFQPTKPGDHYSLADARAQAEMFQKMLQSKRQVDVLFRRMVPS